MNPISDVAQRERDALVERAAESIQLLLSIREALSGDYFDDELRGVLATLVQDVAPLVDQGAEVVRLREAAAGWESLAWTLAERAERDGQETLRDLRRIHISLVRVIARREGASATERALEGCR